MNPNIRQVPVFAFPNCLKFFLGSKSSHTQILTLYSPYDFAVKYKVHCHSNAWDKYIVPNPEGTIPPRSTLDLVVTHKVPIPGNCNVVDKFKIVILDYVTDQVIGKKHIESILLPGEKDSRIHNEDDFEFHSSHDGSSRSMHNSSSPRAQMTDRTVPSSTSNSYISSVIVAVCATILFLPTDAEVQRQSNLPSYLHVSHKIQLLAALLLGVFLCILVRS